PVQKFQLHIPQSTCAHLLPKKLADNFQAQNCLKNKHPNPLFPNPLIHAPLVVKMFFPSTLKNPNSPNKQFPFLFYPVLNPEP
ncbi:MAG: hypothetical protein ABSG67_22625, partial [Thermoguttaceae bacterium]